MTLPGPPESAANARPAGDEPPEEANPQAVASAGSRDPRVVRANRIRRRIVAAMLAAFAIWPLLHYQLVRTFDSSPWKLFGWAMYTRGRYVPTVEVYHFDDRLGRRKLALAGARFAEAEAERRRFTEWAEAIGTLARSDRLAQAVAAALGQDHGSIEIVVLRFRIDRSSDFVVVGRDSTFYRLEDLVSSPGD